MRILIHIFGVFLTLVVLLMVVLWVDSQETYRGAAYNWNGKSVSIESNRGWIHLDLTVEVRGRFVTPGAFAVAHHSLSMRIVGYTSWYSTNLIVAGGRYRHPVEYDSGEAIETTGVGLRHGGLVMILAIPLTLYMRWALRSRDAPVTAEPEMSNDPVLGR